MPMANVEVGWEVALDRAFRTIAHKGTAVARPELGHSVHVEVAGLEPGREYFYRFHCGAEVSQIGRTKTAPAEGAAVDSLRFAVCGCSHYETGYFTAFRRIAAEQFDFVFHTGDYIYECRADGGKNPARRPAAPRRRDLHGRRLPEPLRALQDRIRISRPRMRPRRSSSRGTTTRWTTTTPGTWTSATRRRSCSCCAAPPPIRRTTRPCRSGRRRCRPDRRCACIGDCDSAA